MAHLRDSKLEKFYWKGKDPLSLENKLEEKLDAHHHCHDKEAENKQIK